MPLKLLFLWIIWARSYVDWVIDLDWSRSGSGFDHSRGHTCRWCWPQSSMSGNGPGDCLVASSRRRSRRFLLKLHNGFNHDDSSTQGTAKNRKGKSRRAPRSERKGKMGKEAASCWEQGTCRDLEEKREEETRCNYWR